MACCLAKVSEEEIKTGFFHPSDLVNTRTTILLSVSEEQWIYIVYVIESAAYRVICTSCLCQKPERARYK